MTRIPIAQACVALLALVVLVGLWLLVKVALLVSRKADDLADY